MYCAYPTKYSTNPGTTTCCKICKGKFTISNEEMMRIRQRGWNIRNKCDACKVNTDKYWKKVNEQKNTKTYYYQRSKKEIERLHAIQHEQEKLKNKSSSKHKSMFEVLQTTESDSEPDTYDEFENTPWEDIPMNAPIPSVKELEKRWNK